MLYISTHLAGKKPKKNTMAFVVWFKISWFPDVHADSRNRQRLCLELRKCKCSTWVVMARKDYTNKK